MKTPILLIIWATLSCSVLGTHIHVVSVSTDNGERYFLYILCLVLSVLFEALSIYSLWKRLHITVLEEVVETLALIFVCLVFCHLLENLRMIEFGLVVFSSMLAKTAISKFFK